MNGSPKSTKKIFLTVLLVVVLVLCIFGLQTMYTTWFGNQTASSEEFENTYGLSKEEFKSINEQSTGVFVFNLAMTVTI